MLEARGRVVAFLMPDQHHAPAVNPGQAADHGRVVGERAVTGQRQEVIGNAGDIIFEMGPLRMPCDLRLLPRSQLRLGVAKELSGLGFEPADLGIDVEVAVVRGLAKLRDPRLELGDRFFKIQVGQHFRCAR
jgi:hypothetical protein